MTLCRNCVVWMRAHSRILIVTNVLVVCSGVTQVAAGASVPCVPQGATAGWMLYIDRADGFCLLYPADYKRIRHSTRRKGTVDLRTSDSDIYIFLEHKAFDLQRLLEHAPTGADFPPQAEIAGPNTFYYYGTGGGGVSYPDQFFLDMKGKTLYITFDGPYDNGKSPSTGTRALEPKILSTLRVF